MPDLLFPSLPMVFTSFFQSALGFAIFVYPNKSTEKEGLVVGSQSRILIPIE
jgi:hypothetical protein